MLQNLSSAADVIGALRVKLFEDIHMVEKLASLDFLILYQLKNFCHFFSVTILYLYTQVYFLRYHY